MRQILKEAREKAHMTQKEVAEYLGITLRSYQRIEAGDFLGKLCHWDALEDLFKVHQRELRQEACQAAVKGRPGSHCHQKKCAQK